MIGLEIRYFVYPPPVKIRRLQVRCLPAACPAMLQRPQPGHPHLDRSPNQTLPDEAPAAAKIPEALMIFIDCRNQLPAKKRMSLRERILPCPGLDHLLMAQCDE
jgi:hypothetical protein